MSGVRRGLLALGVAGVLAASVGTSYAGSPRAEPSAHAAIRPVEGRELVVLVHGLGRSRLSMLPLAWSLERRGYRVLNWGYSSTSATIPELGAELSRDLASLDGPPPERIHFVGHSLGNIIIRWVVANRPPEHVGRVVMLAPPNQGSHSADRYAPWLGWLLRPLPELRTAPGSTARTIPTPPGVEIGVIAGRYDGKVSVPETFLPGAKARVVIPAAHTFIMDRRDVGRLVVRFLYTGDFAPPPPVPSAPPLSPS
ncbi:MAG: hypothetical protein JO040_01270 [Gemmatimonadetes bacterium]|nr:hypothetical protein [Gemmatimonadota bacterium]